MEGAARAAVINNKYSGVLQAAAFSAVAGGDPRTCILRIMARRVTNPQKLKSIKAELQLPDWTLDITALR